MLKVSFFDLFTTVCKSFNVFTIRSVTSKSSQKTVDIKDGSFHQHSPSENSEHLWKNSDELFAFLIKNQLFKNDHIVAFNKPNGLPMHSAKYEVNDISPSQPSDFLSVASCMNQISKKLGVQELYPVFSQNRLHSGVIVFCLSKESRDVYSRYFKNSRANRKFISAYNVVCLGKLSQTEKAEVFHIYQDMLNNHLMSMLAEGKGRKIATTTSEMKFEILKKSEVAFKCYANYLLVWPTTVKWDALELFGVEKLAPVLGDHKYSSRVQTILDRPIHIKPDEAFPQPQDVPKDILKELNIEEECVADIPLHIHCSQVILPRLFQTKSGLSFRRTCLQNDLCGENHEQGINSHNIVINAPLPLFYLKTLKRLKLD